MIPIGFESEYNPLPALIKIPTPSPYSIQVTNPMF